MVHPLRRQTNAAINTIDRLLADTAQMQERNARIFRSRILPKRGQRGPSFPMPQGGDVTPQVIAPRDLTETADISDAEAISRQAAAVEIAPAGMPDVDAQQQSQMEAIEGLREAADIPTAEQRAAVMQKTIKNQDPEIQKQSEDIIKEGQKEGKDRDTIFDELQTFAAYVSMDQEQPGENFFNVFGRAAARMHLDRQKTEQERRKLVEQRQYDEKIADKKHAREVAQWKRESQERQFLQNQRLDAAMDRLEFSENADAAREAKKEALAKQAAAKKAALKEAGALSKRDDAVMDKFRTENNSGSNLVSVYRYNLTEANKAISGFKKVKAGVNDDGSEMTLQDKYVLGRSSLISLVKAQQKGVLTDKDVAFLADSDPTYKKLYLQLEGWVSAKRVSEKELNAMLNTAISLGADSYNLGVEGRRKRHESYRKRLPRLGMDLAGLNSENNGTEYMTDKRYNYNTQAQAIKALEGADEVPEKISVAGTAYKVFKTFAERDEYYRKNNVPSFVQALVLED